MQTLEVDNYFQQVFYNNQSSILHLSQFIEVLPSVDWNDGMVFPTP